MNETVRFVLRNALASSALMPTRLRVPLLRAGGIEIGHGVELREGLRLMGRIRLGDRVFLNSGTYIDAGQSEVILGQHVVVGVDCVITAAGHDIGPAERRAHGFVSEKIVVGDGAWIGARAVVLPGVTIGSGCVIGAASVVLGDTEPNSVYVGAPARQVRALPET